MDFQATSGQRIEIPLSKPRTTAFAILWLFVALGSLWLSVKSFDPYFFIDMPLIGTTKVEWLINQMPVSARVGLFGLIGITFLMLFAVTGERLISNAPALIMDADGIEGYAGGISRSTVRMRWDEIGEMTTLYGQMIIYSKRESMFAKRKLISVQTEAVGKTGNDIAATMQAFMLVSKLPGHTAPHSPQLATRPAPAMAGASKPTFGTRRT